MTTPLQFDIRVRTHYIADQSDPADNRFVFAYTIRITNAGELAAKLISRHRIYAPAKRLNTRAVPC
jgi:ApaG protein